MFKTSEIKAYKNNTRNNADAVGPVAESITQLGIKDPFIIDKYIGVGYRLKLWLLR